MANVGPLELAVVLVIVLIVFGPKRLPELGRSLGHGMREFKSSLSGEGENEDRAEEPRAILSGEPAVPAPGDVSSRGVSTESKT